MAGHRRPADAQWESTVARLIERRLDPTTAAERDLAGQLLLDLLTGRNDVAPVSAGLDDVGRPVRVQERDDAADPARP